MHMLTDQLFKELIKSAAMAPSADNMQPWEFRRQCDAVEVFPALQRMQPTDVSDMFTWVSIGAAIQNIVVTSSAYGLEPSVEYLSPGKTDQAVAVIKLSPGITDGFLAEWISQRATNRNNYKAEPLEDSVISELTQNIYGLNAAMHWTKDPKSFRLMASMDA